MSGPVPRLPTRGDAVLTNLRLIDGIDERPQDGRAIVIRDGVMAGIVPEADAASRRYRPGRGVRHARV